jgi:hypothetical protein
MFENSGIGDMITMGNHGAETLVESSKLNQIRI